MSTSRHSDEISNTCSSLEDSTHGFDRRSLHTSSRQRRKSHTNIGEQDVVMYTSIPSKDDEVLLQNVRSSARAKSESRSRFSATTTIRTTTTTTVSSEEDVLPTENDLLCTNDLYDSSAAMQRTYCVNFSNFSNSSLEWNAPREQEVVRELLRGGDEVECVGQQGYQQASFQGVVAGIAEYTTSDVYGEKEALAPLSEKNDDSFLETDMFAAPVDEQRAELCGGVQPALEGKGDGGKTASDGVSNERMKFDRPEDPRNLIINVILNSAFGSVTLQHIHDVLQWEKNFEEANGSVLDYLQGYQSIFAVSPVDDRVKLRRSLHTVKGHRSKRGQRGYHAISSRIGSISYSYVATAFDLDMLSTIYKRRGYEVELIYGVLHVYSQRVFDLFLFSNGVVVWWGLNRPDHWVVDDDFLSSAHSFVREAVKERHDQEVINNMFPCWCSYELDGKHTSSTAFYREEELGRFATNLCFDHYLIPNVEPIRTQIMMTVSYSLGRTAVVDFFDFVTQSLQKEVLSIPSSIKGIRDYFSARRQIARIEGKLQLARMATMALRDTPEFLWEMAWLYDYYLLAEKHNASVQLLVWFMSKSEALLQQLGSIKTRRFRLFMLGSDVFIILLLLIDVIVLMSSFVLRLYFPIEEDG